MHACVHTRAHTRTHACTHTAFWRSDFSRRLMVSASEAAASAALSLSPSTFCSSPAVGEGDLGEEEGPWQERAVQTGRATGTRRPLSPCAARGRTRRGRAGAWLTFPGVQKSFTRSAYEACRTGLRWAFLVQMSWPRCSELLSLVLFCQLVLTWRCSQMN